MGTKTEPGTVPSCEWGAGGLIPACPSWAVAGELLAPELVALGIGSRWHGMALGLSLKTLDWRKSALLLLWTLDWLRYELSFQSRESKYQFGRSESENWKRQTTCRSVLTRATVQEVVQTMTLQRARDLYSELHPDTRCKPGQMVALVMSTWATATVFSLRTGRKLSSSHMLPAGLHPCSPLLSPGACSLQPEPLLASLGCVSPAPALSGFHSWIARCSPGDEFPHYLRDLHIGHVAHRPECPGRVWRVTAGSSLSATYRQAWGSQEGAGSLALAFVLS